MSNFKKQPDIELTESDTSGKCSEPDLISREAALACFHGWVDKHGDYNAPDDMPEYQRIEALPSAELIRCKDCLYCLETGTVKDLVCIRTCDYIKPDYFCSWAERRTDE